VIVVITTKVETFNNYINGEWQESVSKKTFLSVNPANTEDFVGEFQASNEQDVKMAIESAKNAFPSWSQTAPPSELPS
jgi:aldehyde dehydrogenase (NAD+)